MKNSIRPGRKAFVLALTLIISCNMFSQEPTEGSLTFTVETINNGGNFSPDHVLAIWIEDAGGFIKTSMLRADRRKQYLYTWQSRSSGNIVDAVTGATVESHQSHTVTWDGTDVDGNVVEDGEYEVHVEFTDQHAQGPIYSLAFTKGTEEVSLTEESSGKFKNISLLWEPDVVLVPEAAFSFVADELTVTFTNTSSNADSYSWDFGDGNTSTDTEPVHTYAEAGTYQVVLEASAGDATATASQEVTVTGGVTLVVDPEGTMKVYPNPATGRLIVESFPAAGHTAYEIVSLEGRLQQHGTITGASGYVIDLDRLQPGTYVLKLQGVEKAYIIPFVRK